MYEVEVDAGRSEPLPPEIDELLLAESLHTTPMALDDWPADYLAYWRIIRHARYEAQQKNQPGGGSAT